MLSTQSSNITLCFNSLQLCFITSHPEATTFRKLTWTTWPNISTSGKHELSSEAHILDMNQQRRLYYKELSNLYDHTGLVLNQQKEYKLHKWSQPQTHHVRYIFRSKFNTERHKCDTLSNCTCRLSPCEVMRKIARRPLLITQWGNLCNYSSKKKKKRHSANTQRNYMN